MKITRRLRYRVDIIALRGLVIVTRSGLSLVKFKKMISNIGIDRRPRYLMTFTSNVKNDLFVTIFAQYSPNMNRVTICMLSRVACTAINT